MSSLEALEDPDPRRRARAYGELSRREAQELPPASELETALERGLRDDSPKVLGAALETISALAHRELMPFGPSTGQRVLALARHDNDDVRAEAAVCLALIDAPGAASALKTMLEDSSMIVRREAAAALGDLGDRDAISALSDRLEDKDEETRFEAAFALAQLGSDLGLELLIQSLVSERHRVTACEAFRELGDRRAIPPLTRLMSGLFVPWTDKLTAAATLYSLGEKSAGERVLARTRAWNANERAYAISLIGTHGIEEGIEVLLRVAADDKDKARAYAVQALGELARPEFAEPLGTIALDEQAPVELRREAARALRGLPEAATREWLERVSAVDIIARS